MMEFFVDVLKISKDGVFNVNEVLETPCEELDITSGNINDLTNIIEPFKFTF